MQLKTISKNGRITLEDYSDEDLYEIFRQAEGFLFEVGHFTGDDYGGDRCSESVEYSYEGIIPERMLVKDGHFAGVLIQARYDCYNGGSNSSPFSETLILLSDEHRKTARSGCSTSTDDHSDWNYKEYRLLEFDCLKDGFQADINTD